MHELGNGFDVRLDWWWVAEQLTTAQQGVTTRAVREESPAPAKARWLSWT
jgi:hypothetical protein